MTVGLAGGNLRTEYGAPAPPESCPGIAEDPGLQGTRRLHPLGDRRPLACGAVNGHRRDGSTRQISESRLAADRQFGKRRTQEHSVRGFGRFDATGRRSSSHQRSTCLRGTPGRVDSSPSSQHEIEIADRTPAREWCRRDRKNNAIQNRPTATGAGADHRDTRCGGAGAGKSGHLRGAARTARGAFRAMGAFRAAGARRADGPVGAGRGRCGARLAGARASEARARAGADHRDTGCGGAGAGKSGHLRGAARTARGAFRAVGAFRAAGARRADGPVGAGRGRRGACPAGARASARAGAGSCRAAGDRARSGRARGGGAGAVGAQARIRLRRHRGARGACDAAAGDCAVGAAASRAAASPPAVSSRRSTTPRSRGCCRWQPSPSLQRRLCPRCLRSPPSRNANGWNACSNSLRAKNRVCAGPSASAKMAARCW